MAAQRNRRNWIVRAGSQAMAVRLLAVSVGLITATATLAAPAHADTVSGADSFLAALNNAGVAYNDPASTVELGQSICPLLVQPGATFATIASSVAGNGMSAPLTGLFTSIAISTFCPAMMSSLANGNLPNLLQTNLPNLLQLPALQGL